MSSTADRIRTFILTRYLPGESAEHLPDDTALRSSGILNSLATLNLIAFLEQEFGIEIEAYETDIDNFDQLRDIAALVERKREARLAGRP